MKALGSYNDLITRWNNEILATAEPFNGYAVACVGTARVRYIKKVGVNIHDHPVCEWVTDEKEATAFSSDEAGYIMVSQLSSELWPYCRLVIVAGEHTIPKTKAKLRLPTVLGY